MTQAASYYNKTSVRQTGRKPVNLRVFNVFLLVSFLGLGFWHLMNINDLTVKGFALQKLKAQYAELAAEKLDNEQAINDLQSYINLSERTKSLNMEKISDIEYISTGSKPLAKK